MRSPEPGQLKLFVSICNDARLLGHFLKHYTAIGVTDFCIAVAAQLVREVEERARGYRVHLFKDIDVSDIAETAGVSTMRQTQQSPDEWAVIIDLDEFVECPDLPAVIAAADRAGANLVRGIMHDRFSADGQLPAFTDDSDLSQLYPVKSRFVREVMKGYDHKGVLVKGQLKPAPGAIHHWFENERAFADVLEISHYKWTAGAIDRLRKTLRRVQDDGVSWAPEYQRALDHYEAHGRFAWESFGGRLREQFVPEPPAGHCADCGGAIAEAELRYSLKTFGRALCRTDQVTASRR